MTTFIKSPRPEQPQCSRRRNGVHLLSSSPRVWSSFKSRFMTLAPSAWSIWRLFRVRLRPTRCELTLFIFAWLLLIMDGFCAVSMTTPLRGPSAGESFIRPEGPSRRDAGVSTLSEFILSTRTHPGRIRSLCSFLPLCLSRVQPCVVPLIRRRRRSHGWWQMNLQKAAAGDYTSL